MTRDEYDQIAATFPWRTEIVHSGIGGVVRMVDCNGAEVPLFTITRLLEYITQKLKERESK